MPVSSKPKYQVAIYCRFATAEQAGIDKQEETLRAYAKEQGYSHPVSYLDNGYSGLNFDRPAFLRLNSDIQAEKVDTLIVRNISHVGRNMIEVENWIEGIEKNGVKFITTDHPYNTKYTQNFHKMIATYLRSQRGARSSKKEKLELTGYSRQAQRKRSIIPNGI